MKRVLTEEFTAVEISRDGVQAELKQDYQQRSIVRLKLTLRGTESVEDVELEAIALVQSAIAQGKLDPIR